MEDATNSDFCKWVCDCESKNARNPDGTLNLEGKTFVMLLKTDPDKVLNLIRKTSQGQVMHFVMDTKKSFIIYDFEKLCNEVLESLKKHFLALNS